MKVGFTGTQKGMTKAQQKCLRSLLAAPKEFEEVRRSGTWATWRAARHIHRARIMILPDGRFDIADCDHLKIQLSTAEVSNG